MIRYVGSLALRDVVGGVSGVLDPLAGSLASLVASVRDAADLTLQAAEAIRALAAADLTGQLAALEASLELPDPAAYLAGLAAGVAAITADLASLVPTVALSAQLSASLDLLAATKAKLAALDAALGPLAAVAAALERAADLTTAAFGAYTKLAADLAATGVHLFVYDGPLADLGVELEQEATASSGLTGATLVHAPVLLVSSVDTTAVRAVNAAMALP